MHPSTISDRLCHVQDANKKVVRRENSSTPRTPVRPTEGDLDPDDPELTRPMPRYNAMLAVLRNTLYM